MPPRKRKHRSDRNHVVYRLTCIPTGEVYYGLTVARGRAFKKSMMIRWKHHVRNALKYEKKTILYDRIREHGPEAWRFEVMEVVRGKQPAHDLELSLIKNAPSALNMEGLGRKKKRAAAV
jgi:hypothetical protein